jgi:hypothetical protein
MDADAHLQMQRCALGGDGALGMDIRSFLQLEQSGAGTSLELLHELSYEEESV